MLLDFRLEVQAATQEQFWGNCSLLWGADAINGIIGRFCPAMRKNVDYFKDFELLYGSDLSNSTRAKIDFYGRAYFAKGRHIAAYEFLKQFWGTVRLVGVECCPNERHSEGHYISINPKNKQLNEASKRIHKTFDVLNFVIEAQKPKEFSRIVQIFEPKLGLEEQKKMF